MRTIAGVLKALAAIRRRAAMKRRNMVGKLLSRLVFAKICVIQFTHQFVYVCELACRCVRVFVGSINVDFYDANSQIVSADFHDVTKNSRNPQHLV